MALDVLLANPLFLSRDSVERRLMTPYFPLGLLYIAATLRQAGWSVAIFDGTFCQDVNAFRAALDEHRPRLVGIGVLSTVRPTALEIAAMARQRGVPVVVGGADPTGRPESYLTALGGVEPPAAVVVIGEGEETVVELIPTLLGAPDARPLQEISGIAYCDSDGEIVRTPPRAPRRDLDAISFPARDLVDISAYQRAWRDAHGYSSLSVNASRGCPLRERAPCSSPRTCSRARTATN